MKSQLMFVYKQLNNTSIYHSIIKCLAVLVLLIISIWVPALVYVAISLLIVFIVFEHSISSMYLLFFFLPFSAIMVYDYTNTLSLYLIALLVWILVCSLNYMYHLITKKKQFPNLYVIISVALLAVYLFIPINAAINIKANVLILSSVMIIYLSTQYKCDFKKVTIFISVGIILSALMGLLVFVVPRLNLSFEIIVENGVIRYPALTRNPNTLYIYALIGLCSLFILNIKKSINDYMFYVLFALLFAIGLLTLSRTFIVSIALLMVVFFCIKVFSKECTDKKRCWIFFIIFLAIVIALCLLLSKQIETYFIRFDYGNGNIEMGDIMDIDDPGRLGIWKRLLKNWASSPATIIFGRGLGAELIGGVCAHNTLIAVLTDLGVVGIAIYVNAFLSVFLNAINYNLKNINIANTLVFLFAFLPVFMAEALYNVHMAVFIYLIFFITYKNNSVQVT